MAFIYSLLLILASTSNLNARPQLNLYPPAAAIVPAATIRAPESPIIIESDALPDVLQVSTNTTEKNNVGSVPAGSSFGPYPAAEHVNESNGSNPTVIIEVMKELPAIQVRDPLPPLRTPKIKVETAPYPAAETTTVQEELFQQSVTIDVDPVRGKDPLPKNSIVEVKTDLYDKVEYLKEKLTNSYSPQETMKELLSGQNPASVSTIEKIAPVEVQDPLLQPIKEVKINTYVTTPVKMSPNNSYSEVKDGQVELNEKYPPAVPKEISPVEVQDPLLPLSIPVIKTKTDLCLEPSVCDDILPLEVQHNLPPLPTTIIDVKNGTKTAEEVPTVPYPAAVPTINEIPQIIVPDPLPPLPVQIIDVKTAPVTPETAVHVEGFLPLLTMSSIEETKAPFVSVFRVVEPSSAASVPVEIYPVSVTEVKKFSSVHVVDPLPPLPFPKGVSTSILTGPYPPTIVSTT